MRESALRILGIAVSLTAQSSILRMPMSASRTALMAYATAAPLTAWTQNRNRLSKAHGRAHPLGTDCSACAGTSAGLALHPVIFASTSRHCQRDRPNSIAPAPSRHKMQCRLQLRNSRQSRPRLQETPANCQHGEARAITFSMCLDM